MSNIVNLHWADGSEFLIDLDSVSIVSLPLAGATRSAHCSIFVGQWFHIQNSYEEVCRLKGKK